MKSVKDFVLCIVGELQTAHGESSDRPELTSARSFKPRKRSLNKYAVLIYVRLKLLILF